MLGIMQGRLTEWGFFNPQGFPWENWKNEFVLAGQYNIKFIEWMFNSENYDKNPLWQPESRKQIKKIMQETGVRVNSVCANWYMQHSISDYSNMKLLNQLVDRMEDIGGKKIIIPLFEESHLAEKEEKRNVLKELLLIRANSNIEIILETDWDAESILELPEFFYEGGLNICYDLGNAVGDSRSVCKELKLLMHQNLIGEIHIKDKKKGGTSVLLGEGDAEFEKYFDILEDFKGGYILESYYDNAVKDTVRNISYVKDILQSIRKGKEQNS